jgi:outer membrane protein OmpA-like peptidoglycan-associated protein
MISRSIRIRVLSLAAGVLLFGAAAAAQGVQDFTSRSPTPDEIIRALKPQGEAGGVVYRGIRPTGAPPQAVPQAQMPAVALNVKFGLNSSTVTPVAAQDLRALGTALASPDLAPYFFLVEGHTDSSGGMAHNMRLSDQRAQSVKAYLMANFNIPGDRLLTLGKGPTSPMAGLPASNAQNRRVEIRTLGHQ